MPDSSLKEKTVHCTGGSDLDRNKVMECMNKHDYCIIRGAITGDEVANGVRRLREKFNTENDNPSSGESPESVKSNFQKINVGGVTKRYNNYPRFFRTFYNPIWADDIYEMREVFVKMAQVRNRILNNELNFALGEIADNGLWTASRIHQYPVGGGFFCEHRDVTLKDVADEARIEVSQLVLVMSEKGKDFQEGGGYVTKGDQRINLDDVVELGDLLLYDGCTLHGVEDIDPHRRLDMTSLNGRLTAFVSLYKDLKPS